VCDDTGTQRPQRNRLGALHVTLLIPGSADASDRVLVSGCSSDAVLKLGAVLCSCPVSTRDWSSVPVWDVVFLRSQKRGQAIAQSEWGTRHLCSDRGLKRVHSEMDDAFLHWYLVSTETCHPFGHGGWFMVHEGIPFLFLFHATFLFQHRFKFPAGPGVER
jgi:hypothetical protein